MIFYWIPFVLSLVNCVIKNNKINDIINIICVIIMCLLSALRSIDTGTDSLTYSMYVTGERDILRLEYLYSFIIAYCANYGSYRQLFVITALITYIPLFVVLRRYLNHNLKYAVLLYNVSYNVYFLDSMNAIRQIAATSFIVCAIVLWEKRVKYLPYLSLFIACGLHSSSFLFLPFILLSKIKLSHNNLKYSLIALLLVVLSLTSLFSANFVTDFLGSITLFNIDSYVSYISETKYGRGSTFVGAMILLFFPIFSCIHADKLNHGNKSIYSYYWGLVLLSILSTMTQIASRATLGLYAMELFVVPVAISIAIKNKKSVSYFFFMTYLLFRVSFYAYNLIVQYSAPDQMGPYHFYFD